MGKEGRNAGWKKGKDAGMKGSMADYIISSMAETAIMDVFPYADEKDKSEFKNKRA